MRTIVAVVVGYLVFAVASVTLFFVAGQEPHDHVSMAFAAVATIYGMVAAFVGGLIAAAIARRPSGRASVLVAGLITVGALVSMLNVPAGGSRWSMVAAVVLMAPAALAGGYFYRRLTATATHPPKESA